MISDRFANGLGYSVETKAKSGGDSKDTAYSEMESNGSEFSLTYQYKMNYRLTYVSGFAASQLLLVMLRNQLFDAGYGSLRACPQSPH